MAADPLISQWVQNLHAGDAAAADKLWGHYFPRLVQLARHKLPRPVRRVSDEEDVALSAFNSFFRGLERGRFPELRDRDGLWHLLVLITARKAQAHVRRQTRQKRGGGKVLAETDLLADGDTVGVGLAEVVGKEPTPAFAAQVAEECRRLLDGLEDEALRATALLKMEGWTRDEIAARLGKSTVTIARRLDLIRRIWTDQLRPER